MPIVPVMRSNPVRVAVKEWYGADPRALAGLSALQDAFIVSWEDVADLTSSQWMLLAVPLGLKNRLIAAAKMSLERRTRTMTPDEVWKKINMDHDAKFGKSPFAEEPKKEKKEGEDAPKE
eukprot:CAMPEP_0177661218 /NCGR_PEP_ID=MMETSP0447-20121125/18535_1 /TAXON_ID=0 /ORGANISM="Stygamoeba regulata, Strain BSH-02190019" /LENGTH=119 /DNA_ID=CAMNT_0019166493 /DNA_START=254 /DNA_END=613 /DNA_ORIENTATION=-